MNTIFSLKRVLFLAVFAILLAFPSGQLAQAQEVTPATSVQVQELNDALVALLTQLIAQLQAQIDTLIAQQTATQTQLGAVQSQVNTVVTQTASVVTPIVTPTPTPTKSKQEQCSTVGITPYYPSENAKQKRLVSSSDNQEEEGYWYQVQHPSNIPSLAIVSDFAAGGQKFIDDNPTYYACFNQ